MENQGTASEPAQLGRSTSLSYLMPPRRQSAQERIDGILKNALQRADTIHRDSQASQASRPGGDPNMPAQRAADAPDDSPDETTSIVAGQESRNYQSTQTTSKLRSRHLPQSRPDPNPANQNGGSSHHDTETKGWLDGIWSIELENKGSVARDHLALERTFLAWLRTSLSFASIGIAITQLFRLNTAISDDAHLAPLRHLGRPLGSSFIGISIVVLLLGYHRYYESQQWVLRGKFPASRGTIILVSFIAFALMVASLIVIVFIQPAT